MRKTLAATALALATTTSAAFADPAEAPKPQAQAAPVVLTTEQMDQVVGGREKPMQGEVLARFRAHGGDVDDARSPAGKTVDWFFSGGTADPAAASIGRRRDPDY